MFLTALAFHIAAGVTCVISGALAATARKRPGRHPKAGRIYLWAMAVVFTTATRWRYP
jgi:threonine/homoserine/homoserine lactone efflux protein